MTKLSPKQEIFVRGLVAGLSQREAYKSAYSTTKMKETTIDVEASKLLKNPKITIRYRELLKEHSNMILWNREQSFNEYEWLKNKAKEDIILKGIKQANSSAFLSALDGMNNMAFRELELVDNKIRKEIEFLETKIDAIKSTEHDTSLMESLLEVLNNE